MSYRHSCNLRPTAPKHKLVQKSMLANHTYTPTFSDVWSECMPGIGTNWGLNRRDRRVPPMLMVEESARPGLDRSMRYQRIGSATANVMETCSVDCHGILLCSHVSGKLDNELDYTYEGKSNAYKGTNTSDCRMPDRP